MSGTAVACGKCRDVAHESLLHAASLSASKRNAPILSVSRPHGHLLFCGRPGRNDGLRRGHVVEWRVVRIDGFAILRDPNYIAVLVENTVIRCSITDGDSVQPVNMCVWTAVEQNAGGAPRRVVRSCQVAGGRVLRVLRVLFGWMVKYHASWFDVEHRHSPQYLSLMWSRNKVWNLDRAIGDPTFKLANQANM